MCAVYIARYAANMQQYARMWCTHVVQYNMYHVSEATVSVIIVTTSTDCCCSKLLEWQRVQMKLLIMLNEQLQLGQYHSVPHYD